MDKKQMMQMRMLIRKNVFFKLRLVLLLLFTISLCCDLRKADERPYVSKEPPDRPTEITLERYMGSLRTIEAQVGSDTLSFIFDTGGGLTIITPELADKVGCTPFGRITVFRMPGERIDVQRCGEVKFDVNGIPIRIETTIFDIMSLLPKDWPKVGGLLSLDTFGNHIITIDLSRDRMVKETEGSLKDRIVTMRPVNMRINHQTGGWGLDVFVEVEAPKGSLWFELDTGNMSEVFLAPHAIEQLGITLPTGDKGTIDSDSDVFETTLNIPGFEPLNVKARKQDLIYDGVLNAATIGKLVLTLDLANGKMWAKMSE